VAGTASKGVASARLQDPGIGPSTREYLSLSHKRRPAVGWGRCLEPWCVPQNFLYPQRDQPLLITLDMCEWLPLLQVTLRTKAVCGDE
jgi:hypothetical protein